MPGPLLGVTLTTPDLEASCTAYRDYLGYEGDRSRVEGDLAEQLGVPALAGRAAATLHPASGGPRFIRLVDGPADPAPLTTFGWTAVELIVRDLDRLTARLAGGPFKVIGPPATLDFDFTDAIRAMQVVGPSGEVLYLTEVAGPVPGFDLPRAEADVGSPFIAVAGVPDLAGWATDARDAAGFESGAPIEARVEVLSAALGLPPDTRHRLTTVALGDASYLEVDHLPAPSTHRPLRRSLPCGIIAAAIGADDALPPALIGPLHVEWYANQQK